MAEPVGVTGAQFSEPSLPRRVYPLDARLLSEEQIAVAFAMTSRRPEPFDEIARQVSEEKAADFHERWVLGYGHASVAEHAVVHLAVENISRLACDGLEDNRLASYTEKSSRYQVMDAGYFHVPAELDGHPELRREYVESCRYLFDVYQQLIDRCMEYLRGVHSQRSRESDTAYQLRLRRIATDGCRSVLPASTLTNVGITSNARTLELAISKLMSSELLEERELGEAVREQGREVTPTLIKYADVVEYLEHRPALRRTLADELGTGGEQSEFTPEVRLVHWDPQAEESSSLPFCTVPPQWDTRRHGSGPWRCLPKNAIESSAPSLRAGVPTMRRPGSLRWSTTPSKFCWTTARFVSIVGTGCRRIFRSC